MYTKKTILIAFLTFGLMACKEEKLAENRLSNTEKISVKTYPLVQTKGALPIESTGLLTTENEANYAFKIGGVIAQIYVREGAFFKKGQLLAKLKLDEIDAGFMQAKLGFEKAERDFKRLSNLFKDSVATLEQFQNTQTAFELAKQQLESISFNKEYASIYATADGFVVKKLANEGEIIGGGMPVLATNQHTQDTWILKVGLSDKDWAVIEKGNLADVVLDAFPSKVFKGEVIRKSMAASRSNGSFEIEIQVNCKEVKPAIGMFGKATILSNTSVNSQFLPYDALIEADGKNAYVFVPISTSKVKRVPIEISHFNNSGVWVKSGLSGVKEVVLSNSAFLNENSIIRIIQ
ncbi:MAG: efflux RND transporter periplasmic adaptor subunit [Bacteroidota bacterium]|nr:efflux RND transporter periplasmic adaptor subunit [Bacteroidota bacterium]